MSADVVELLRDALGDRVDTSAEALDAARADKSGHAAPERPLAVVHAESVADVQRVLRIASATSTPVVTRGAGTGLAGGANAGPGVRLLRVTTSGGLAAPPMSSGGLGACFMNKKSAAACSSSDMPMPDRVRKRSLERKGKGFIQIGRGIAGSPLGTRSVPLSQDLAKPSGKYGVRLIGNDSKPM